MADLIRKSSGPIDLTEDELSVIAGGLYERLDETNRYIDTANRVVDSHADHGEVCCCKGLVTRETESLRYLRARRTAILSALAKVEPESSREARQ